jgi:hypothetical protein
MGKNTESGTFAGGFIRLRTDGDSWIQGGNVGIGTTSPGARLDVSDGSSYFYIRGNAAGDFQAPALAPHIATGDFTIYAGAIGSGTARVTVKNGGNVGIGTTSPGAPLEVYGTSGDGTPTFKITSTAASNTFNWAGTILNSSLGSSRNYLLIIGQAASTKNSGYIGYNHSGTGGSNSNYLTFGHYGSDNLVNINDLQFLKFRDILYDIFIYNLDITDCIWYILSNLIEQKKINNEHLSKIMIRTYGFFQYYNNNYRPIYHVENYFLYLAKLIHGF